MKDSNLQVTKEEVLRMITGSLQTYDLSIPEEDRNRLVATGYNIGDYAFVEFAVLGYAVAKGWKV